MALGPEELSQIVDALMDTEPMQWVRDQMQGGPQKMEREEDGGLDIEDGMDDGAMIDDGAGDDLGGEIPDDDSGAMIDDGAIGGGGDIVPGADDGGQGDMLGDDELADMDDDERAEYDSLEDDHKAVYARGRRRGKGKKTKPALSRPTKLSRSASTRTEAERYARERAAKQRHSAVDREVNGLKTRLAQLEKEKRHATRYSRLQDKQADGYVFDLEEEFGELKDVSDDEFKRALGRVEKYARAPVSGHYIPTPDAPAPRDAAKAEQYSRKRTARAVAICEADPSVQYAEALARADKELGGGK